MELQHGCYFYQHEPLATWPEARASCLSMGVDLAIITSQEENDAIYTYLDSYSGMLNFIKISQIKKTLIQIINVLTADRP